MIFVSSLAAEGLFSRSNLDSLKEECFADHEGKSISVLLWQQGIQEPSFLKVGNYSFAPTSHRVETKLLVVIFVVGLISPQSTPTWDITQRKRKMPPCANYPLESSQERGQEV